MAVILEIDYAKKVGLPGYSSHQCSVSMRSEVANVDAVPGEVARLYNLLQQSVDNQIVRPGFIPGEEPPVREATALPGAWNCSDKQKALILKIVDEQKLDRTEVDDLAVERFGRGVTRLNKLEASGLIDELLGKRPRASQRKAA